VNAHPTHYRWKPDVKDEVERYLNMDGFEGKIWIVTYRWHPPHDPPNITRDYAAESYDVWDWDGRGIALPSELGSRVDKAIFNDDKGLPIDWRIYKGWMWDDHRGFVRWNPPEDGSDPGHWKHGHYTKKIA
jgi:hypothetical protein